MPDNNNTSQSFNDEMASIIGPEEVELNSQPNTVSTNTTNSLSVSEATLFTKLAERERTSLSWVFLVFVWIAGVAFIYVAATRILHFALPIDANYKIFGILPFHTWLSKEQIQEIDKILFSGSIGGVLATYAKGKLGR